MSRLTPSSPLRYPGGKASLSNFVESLLKHNGLVGCSYIEPYAGGAGLALRLLERGFVDDIYLNDKCPLLSCFWRVLFNDTENLLRLISKRAITMEQWHKAKVVLANYKKRRPLEVAYAFFFLNRTNFSGVIDAGVIGGKRQAGTYKLDARFPKQRLINLIERVANRKEHVHLYNRDALDFLREDVLNLAPEAFVYCDPPYYVKGQGLYLNAYSNDDHAEVARYIRAQRDLNWIVSYDNEPAIVELYRGEQMYSFDLQYSARQVRMGKELLVLSPCIKMPVSTTSKQSFHEVLARR